LTFLLWLLYRPLTPEAEPAVALASDPMAEHIDLPGGNRMMTTNDAGRQKVLGLGGVFVRARDPKTLADWYREHLGFDVHDFGGAFGAIFQFSDREPGYQLWTAFPVTTKNFGSAAQPQMLNFRVADLDGLLAQLRAGGVTVEEKVERSEYGAFGWCLDGEGNRVELWQPPEG
jgi:catechol 2,3-dioxygenase-like lactoylglutathione lyase family enzyme